MTNIISRNFGTFLGEELLASTGRYSDLTVIIPTLNEVGSLSEVIHSISEVVPGANVVVADDGSIDGTCALVEWLARKFRHLSLLNVSLLDRRSKKLHGITASLLDAIKLCNTEYIAVLDADTQHPPELLVKLYAALKSGGDVAIGTRERFSADLPWYRVLTSKCAARIGSRKLSAFGLNVKDPLSGFFSLRKSVVLYTINDCPEFFTAKGYKFLFDLLKGFVVSKSFQFVSIPLDSISKSDFVSKSRESMSVNIIKSHKRPLTILTLVEVPYCFGARKTGTSKLKLLHIWCFLKSCWFRKVNS